MDVWKYRPCCTMFCRKAWPGSMWSGPRNNLQHLVNSWRSENYPRSGQYIVIAIFGLRAYRNHFWSVDIGSMAQYHKVQQPLEAVVKSTQAAQSPRSVDIGLCYSPGIGTSILQTNTSLSIIVTQSSLCRESDSTLRGDMESGRISNMVEQKGEHGLTRTRQQV
jgi:hypothetical protein